MPTKTPFKLTVSPERERELRERLGIAGTAFEEELAATLHCSGRTVQRLDLPYWVVAGRRLYDLRGAAERLQELARITGSSSDNDGALPPAIRHRLRMQREREATEPPAPA